MSDASLAIPDPCDVWILLCSLHVCCLAIVEPSKDVTREHEVCRRLRLTGVDDWPYFLWRQRQLEASPTGLGDTETRGKK
jgi:hypothetical protein